MSSSLRTLTYPHLSAKAAIQTHHADGVAFGVTNDSCLQMNPSPTKILCMWDGSLWERERITSELGCEPDITDLEICIRAYRRWGAKFAVHLHGTFTFALWNVGTRELILGRDVEGSRPLHYSHLHNGFLFASEILGLLSWPCVDRTVEEWLLVAPTSEAMSQHGFDSTMFAGIKKVLPGHVLTYHGGKIAVERYWDPCGIPMWRTKNRNEYAEAILHAEGTAVRQRIAMGSRVGAHLSAGFDSSGVTALAAQALGVQNKRLTAFTEVPVGPIDEAMCRALNRFGDEGPLASLVAARFPNIDHVLIPSNAARRMEVMEKSVLPRLGAGLFRNDVWFYAIHELASSRGIDVMLGAQCGNLTTSYTGELGLWALRKENRWVELARAVRLRRRAGQPLRSLALSIWNPSASVQQRIQKLRGRGEARAWEASSLFAPEMVAKFKGTAIANTGRFLFPLVPGYDSARAARAELLGRADQGELFSYCQRVFGMAYYDPTGDRRVRELCLSIPDEEFCRGGHPRQLFRNAMNDLLPREVLYEKKRGLQSADFHARFSEDLEEIRQYMSVMQRSTIVKRYLDVNTMSQMLDRWPHQGFHGSIALDMAYSYQFGTAFNLAFLLHKLEEQGYMR